MNPVVDSEFLHRLRTARDRAVEELLRERNADGHWTGELSSSALSTATAVTALTIYARAANGFPRPAKREEGQGERISREVIDSLIQGGLQWLSNHQNADGGWGDTVRSFSNISTTTLVWAAFGAVPGADEKFRETVQRAEVWLKQKAGGLDPDHLVPAIEARYGKDRTFSIPILTMSALAGRLGPSEEAWPRVRPLPFELAAVPHQLYGALRLPVVSYALPALIAIGQVRHHFRPTRNPITRLLRAATRASTLKKLTAIQPSNGGFLEATPLTSFVTMSLAAMGLTDHLVTKRGVDFLVKSARSDGSWAIDTNLATWVTTLSVNALAPSETKSERILQWLLGQQYRVEHLYTHAAPGGWAWTDLPGGAPDADDTAGALLALRELQSGESRNDAVTLGIEWLLNLQNRDGGIPTFCRGWGALQFDRSSPDLTAHALRGWITWLDELSVPLRARVRTAIQKAVNFLAATQRADGAWLPLWFGHQESPDDENPLYGTTRVLVALHNLEARQLADVAAIKAPAMRWLLGAQNPDGGWAGALNAASSVEETALAVEALSHANLSADERAALIHGANWLIERVTSGAWREPSPIGFYFARLWYFEKLYPLIFTTGALNAAVKALAR